MIRNVNFKLFKKLLDKSRLKSIIIDIDSTVINVEGHQEGTAKGYNPEKPGNRCYNTLMAFCNELKAFITGFTRSGNTYTANGAAEMIAEIIENLRDSVDTITFRMDSGYFDENIIKTIEGAGYCYIIKAKQYGNMVDKLYRGDPLQWAEYDNCKEIAEISMRPDKWERPRRFVVVRRLKPEEERRQRIREVLELVRLPEVEALYPSELSGGMAQRVGLARGIIAKPDLLLLDEPFSALDFMTRSRLQMDFSKIQAELGMTMVLITHDVNEAVLLSDKTVFLDEGKVKQEVNIDLPKPRRFGDQNLLPYQQTLFNFFLT